MDFFKIKGRVRRKPRRGEEFQPYMVWQMMMSILHSYGQPRTEKDEYRERMSETCCTAEDY